MSKPPVDQAWFNQIFRGNSSPMDTVQRFIWLRQLGMPLARIADFGCFGSDEPFALLWALDADEVVVVEKCVDNLTEPKQRLETLQKTNPACMEGRTIEFVTADMSTEITRLPTSYFDLAYCKEVLYNLYEPDRQKLRNAISQMARITKPGGFVVALECQIGLTPRKNPSGDVFHSLEMIGEHVDVSDLFEEVGLAKTSLHKPEEGVYCFQKPALGGPRTP